MPDLIIPKREDLTFRENLLENEKTMEFNHEIIPFPEEEWDNWMSKWIFNANPKSRFYRFVFCDGCNDFVALCGWEKLNNIYELILIVDAKKRNVGYGTSALKLLANEALKYDIENFYTKIYLDNPAIKFLKKSGFEEIESNLRTVTLKVKTNHLIQITENQK